MVPQRRLCLALITTCVCALPFGCAGTSQVKPHPLEDSTRVARSAGKLSVLFVVEPSRGAADQEALAAFRRTAKRWPGVLATVLDLDVSRDRAASMPYHGLTAPTLVCVSPEGIIVSRDEGVADEQVMANRIAQANGEFAAADATFKSLRDAAGDTPSRMALAEFLLAHENAREAIAPLKAVADDEEADLETRVHAWVEMGRAHLWIGEPEKGRYASIRLAETLGPKTATAIAGCNLVRGIQDTNAKRFGRARDEFELAISSAPTSPYAKEAATLLAKLPPREAAK